MTIKTQFELDQFIAYLNKFTNLYVTNTEWHKGFWYISFSDGEKYSLSEKNWNIVQNSVSWMKEITAMVQ